MKRKMSHKKGCFARESGMLRPGELDASSMADMWNDVTNKIRGPVSHDRQEEDCGGEEEETTTQNNADNVKHPGTSSSDDLGVDTKVFDNFMRGAAHRLAEGNEF